MVGNIGCERADGGKAVELRHRSAEHLHRGRHACGPAGGGGLDITLNAGHLSGKADARLAFQRVGRVEQTRRVEERVAVHHAVAHELRVPERRDHGEHALLLAELEVGLAADQIVQRAVRVVAAQLEDRIGVFSGLGVGQADRLEDAEAQRIIAAARVDLDGHAALEHLGVLEAVHRRLLGGGERVPECVILLARERAVDVVRRALAVAGSLVGGVHIDALRGHDGRGRVVEVQEIAAHPGVDGVEQRIRGQRAGGDDDAALRDLRYLAVDHFDIRVVPDLFGDGCGERLAVHRQCTACLDAVRVRAGQNEAVQTAQLLLEQARRVGELIRAQRVRADKLCEIVRVMRRAVLRRFHLAQAHGNAALRELPCSLTAGQSRADDGNGIIHPGSPLPWSFSLRQAFSPPPFSRRPSSPSPRPFRPHILRAPLHTAPAALQSAPARPRP